jgi:hypothetical protein
MRLDTRMVHRVGLLGIVAAIVAAPAAPASWSTPTILFQDAGSGLFAAAGDPSGRAFLVAGGTASDVPLVLTERGPVKTGGADTVLEWGPGQPLDGSVLPFASSGLGRAAVRGAAAGAGSGVISFRVGGTDGDQVAALIRDPGETFGPAKRILSTAYGWLSDPVPAISPNGTIAVAFATQKAHSSDPVTPGPRPAAVTRGHPSVIVRVAGDPWSRIRVLAATTTAPPVVAVGSDDRPLVAWTRGARVEATVLAEDGHIGPVRRVGTARAGSRIAVAAGARGRAAIAWADANRIVRVARRSGTRFARARRVQQGGASSVGGLTTAIDDRGRVFVAWRDGTDAAGSIVVAQAGVKGPFQISTIATGAALGDPAISARPGGGAIVAWRAPSGWTAAPATPKGVFAPPTAVSAALGPGDETLRVPAIFAGPATSFDLIWRQNLVNVPVPGPAILSAYGDQPVQ